jgi:O-antigen/teichoic acid export membrane protein
MNKQNVSTRSQLYWNTLLKIPGQTVSFVISIIVARILVPNDFGIMGIAMMLIGYTNLFTDFGFTEAIIQKKIEDKKTLDSIFTVNLAVSLILAILFFISSGYIADFFRSPECKNVIRVLSIVFVVTSFSAVPSAILRRDMNFRTLSLINLSSSFLMSLITLSLALNSLGYWALVFGQLIPNLLVTVVICYKVRWVPAINYDHSSMKDVFHFGVWNFTKTQLGFLSHHVDKFVIGRGLGTASLGFYDKAMSLASMPTNSLTANINSVMFSSFSTNKQDKDLLQTHFKKGLSLISFINFPIYIGLVVIAPYFVYSLLGEKWAPMIGPFQIILVGFITKTFGGLTASLNVGIGNYKKHTIRFSIALGVFIVSCLFLLMFNITGIAVSFLIFSIVEIYMLMDLALKGIGLAWKEVVIPVYPGVTASVLMLLITSSISHFLLLDYSVTNMILIAMVGLFSYSLYILIDKSTFTQEFKKLVGRDIKNILSMVTNSSIES